MGLDFVACFGANLFQVFDAFLKLGVGEFGVLVVQHQLFKDLPHLRRLQDDLANVAVLRAEDVVGFRVLSSPEVGLSEKGLRRNDSIWTWLGAGQRQVDVVIRGLLRGSLLRLFEPLVVHLAEALRNGTETLVMKYGGEMNARGTLGKRTLNWSRSVFFV